MNLLGTREPGIYGSLSLKEIESALIRKAKTRDVFLECRQSNHEGDLIDWIQDAGLKGIGVILNAGAYTHTSIAIRDAISGSSAKVIELHLSNIHARESFRHQSMLAPVCSGVIYGFGAQGYDLAFEGILSILE